MDLGNRETVITRSDAVSRGVGDEHLRRMVATRVLTRIRRGSYLDTLDLEALQREQRHRVAVVAAVAAQESAGSVSHQSAAVLWGLPVWGCDLSVVHVTKMRRNAGRRTRLVHVHGAPLEADEHATVGEIAVTSVPRTVVDIACLSGFEAGVVVADAALRDGLVGPEELAAVVDRSRGRSGANTARAVVAFADGRSESVGESRSRVGMHRAGLPAPDLQFEVRRSDGSLVGRADFRWGRLLGEFDGLVKYGRLLRPGETPGDAVVREKRREDELRDLGCDMVRWGWSDLELATALYPRIRTAMDRSARRA